MRQGGRDFVKEFGRSARDYAYTDGLTNTDWAWEFLRRNRTYQRDFRESRAHLSRTIRHSSGIQIHHARGLQGGAAKWGLMAFPDPHKHALQSDIFWQLDALTHAALATTKRSQGVEEPADLDLFGNQNISAILIDNERHLLIVRSPHATIELHLTGANVLFNPVGLTFHVRGLAAVPCATKTLIWARKALLNEPVSSRSSLSRATRTQRRKCLIALDCAQTGGSLQDTAHVFQALGLTRLNWSSSGDESLKKQVWRCRKSGLDLCHGGYRKFL